jgi:hypothetical protein
MDINCDMMLAVSNPETRPDTVVVAKAMFVPP